jgi:short-subunit dehydrogenase
MLAQRGGRIINTASMASLLVPHPQKQIAYNASKAAVVKITQTLGAEWADRGVTVNCMSPGIVNTALIQARGLIWLACAGTAALHTTPGMHFLLQRFAGSGCLSALPSKERASMEHLKSVLRKRDHSTLSAYSCMHGIEGTDTTRAVLLASRRRWRRWPRSGSRRSPWAAWRR